MSSLVKKGLKPFVPPVAIDLLRRMTGGVLEFTGNYESWDAASEDTVGYESEEILRRVVLATRKVVSGEAVYERDSVTFDRVEYSWPLLASLLQVALEKKSLRVIDFGGSLGSTWRQNKKYLKRLNIPLAWHIVEQEHFVSAGQEFKDDILKFYSSIGDASADGADVVVFAASLCYVRDPELFLNQTAATSAQYLILDRLPLIEGSKDRIALQKVSEPIYEASYPVWLFAKDSFMRNLAREWRVVESWKCDLQPDPKSNSYGFFLERR